MLCCACCATWAQHADTAIFLQIKPIELQTVYISDVTDRDDSLSSRRENVLGQFDYSIEAIPSLSVLRRGGFGFEPVLRGQQGNRSVLVIDGMRIAGACTDHMDPATGYIEPINFNKLDIETGGGGLSGTGTAGVLSIHTAIPSLNRNEVNLRSGADYRSSSRGYSVFSTADYSGKTTSISTGITRRHHHNYTAGGNREIAFTQFEKENFYTAWVQQLGKRMTFQMQYIGDRGRNIGFAALPMDVGRANADIGGAALMWYPVVGNWEKFVAKAYLSKVYHEMDDTRRPPESISMHMDMPGWSLTQGGFLQAFYNRRGRTKVSVHAEVYQQFSRAEMTMYPTGEAEMFLVTWPDITQRVIRLNTDFSHEKSLRQKFGINLNGEIQSSVMSDSLGIRQFSVYDTTHLTMRTDPVGAIDLFWQWRPFKPLHIKIKSGIAMRAPGRSELFGFFLFNTQDRYDYLGNSHLKSEKVWRNELTFSWLSNRWSAGVSAFCNLYRDYIYGVRDVGLGGVTPGSSGMKVWQNLSGAVFTGGEARVTVKANQRVVVRSDVSYIYAAQSDGSPLSMIAPLRWSISPEFTRGKWKYAMCATGQFQQNRIDVWFGEDVTSTWAILDASTAYKFSGKRSFTFECVLELANIFDRYYHAHLDWGNIPRMGRSLNLSLVMGWQYKMRKS